MSSTARSSRLEKRLRKTLVRPSVSMAYSGTLLKDNERDGIFVRSAVESGYKRPYAGRRQAYCDLHLRAGVYPAGCAPRRPGPRCDGMAERRPSLHREHRRAAKRYRNTMDSGNWHPRQSCVRGNPLASVAQGATLWAGDALFVLLAIAGNLFTGTGYFLFSGVLNFGDWAAVIRGLEPRWMWQLGLVVDALLHGRDSGRRGGSVQSGRIIFTLLRPRCHPHWARTPACRVCRVCAGLHEVKDSQILRSGAALPGLQQAQSRARSS